MILFAFDNPLASQLAYLGRETASVNLDIIGKLLTVKGYIKAAASAVLSLKGEIPTTQ